MLCVKCQKRPAVVFVQRLENGKTVQEGYCLTCARAMHIQPVDDLMKQFGMSDQDLENMEERMSSFLQEASDSGMLAPMMNGDDTDAGDEPAPQDDFVPGGSPVFPFGFGARQNKDDAKPKNGKKEKAPRRKFLETYCENLTQKARDGKTFAEYRKYIEKDSALERRFQPVKVEEPSLLDTIEVIKGIRVYYEKHHCVRVSDPIVTSIVKLSERYITDRFLPDKAIDLLDESCACCNLRHPEITELMETQRTVADLETREHELENPEPQNGQDAAIDYEALAAVKTDLAKQREKLPALQLKVAEIEVTMDDVAQVIELWTGVPAVKIKETEYGRLQGLEDALKAHIIGQDEAVHAVAGAIKRARADLSGRHRPASFIFVGPTGVGKTELVKQLASQLFDTVDPLISIDMSEYMEKYAVSRLIGSPPGYVGYDEAGQLTEKVRRHPYSVVLFDEIEKAHPDVMNILLQILDEGKINDAQGRTVDFSNTVICMTSNAGSTDQSGATGFGKKAEVASADRSMKALQEFLRPEFIGRVDEIITFKPLSEEDLEKIAALMLDEYKPGLAAHGITLHYTQPALADIVAESSTKYGARELRRTIRKTIEDPVSDALVDGRLDGREVTLELADHDGSAVLDI